jgi:hypothetical protein
VTVTAPVGEAVRLVRRDGTDITLYEVAAQWDYFSLLMGQCPVTGTADSLAPFPADAAPGTLPCRFLRFRRHTACGLPRPEARTRLADAIKRCVLSRICEIPPQISWNVFNFHAMRCPKQRQGADRATYYQ